MASTAGVGADGGRPATVEVLGRTLTLPVEVRQAAQWSAQYLVPAAAAQRIVAPTGLQVAGPAPGWAMVALAACRYDDSDLDPYQEVAVSFVVRRHDAPRNAGAATRAHEFATGDIGAYIHRLPVDQEFTCAAGRDLWGFPKWVTAISIDEPRTDGTPGRAGRGAGTVVRLVDGDAHVLTLTIASGGPLRLPPQAPPTYSWRDGVLRKTAWTTSSEGGGGRPGGGGGRPGGATLVLGRHPLADELRSLGLPRRALFTSSAARMRASFDAAEVVTPGPRGGCRGPEGR